VTIPLYLWRFIFGWSVVETFFKAIEHIAVYVVF